MSAENKKHMLERNDAFIRPFKCLNIKGLEGVLCRSKSFQKPLNSLIINALFFAKRSTFWNEIVPLLGTIGTMQLIVNQCFAKSVERFWNGLNTMYVIDNQLNTHALLKKNRSNI